MNDIRVISLGNTTAENNTQVEFLPRDVLFAFDKKFKNLTVPYVRTSEEQKHFEETGMDLANYTMVFDIQEQKETEQFNENAKENERPVRIRHENPTKYHSNLFRKMVVGLCNTNNGFISVVIYAYEYKGKHFGFYHTNFMFGEPSKYPEINSTPAKIIGQYIPSQSFEILNPSDATEMMINKAKEVLNYASVKLNNQQ